MTIKITDFLFLLPFAVMEQDGHQWTNLKLYADLPNSNFRRFFFSLNNVTFSQKRRGREERLTPKHLPQLRRRIFPFRKWSLPNGKPKLNLRQSLWKVLGSPVIDISVKRDSVW